MLNPARSTVRHRSGKDYRKHSPRHQPPAVRVRRHWRTTVQGRIARPRTLNGPGTFLPTSRSTLEWHNIQQNLRYPPLIDPSALSYDPILYAYIIVILVHPLLHIRLMQRRDNSPSPNSLLPIRLPPRYAFARHPDSILRRLFATFSVFCASRIVVSSQRK